MTTAAPAPGWWLASDGRWYPPQWEYCWFTRTAGVKIRDPNVTDAMKSAQDEAASLGAQGWEMVNFTTEYVVLHGTGGGLPTQYFLVSCFMKRMVPKQVPG